MSLILPLKLTLWDQWQQKNGRTSGVPFFLLRLIRTIIMVCFPLGWVWLWMDLVRRQQFYDHSYQPPNMWNSRDAAYR